jgi:hypothetical protein
VRSRRPGRSLTRMRTLLARLVLLACAGTALGAAPGDAAPALAPADSAGADSAQAPSRFYYGGGIGFTVSSRLTQIGLLPHVGYKLGPKTSLGARLRYEYFRDRRVEPEAESHSYGGGLFTRYRFARQVYGQAELAFMQYDWSGDPGSVSVPSFLIGGGYAQPVGPKTWLTVDVMFDLIQDENSPYRDGSPRVTTGITANF